jgi:hypothetical protein
LSGKKKKEEVKADYIMCIDVVRNDEEFSVYIASSDDVYAVKDGKIDIGYYEDDFYDDLSKGHVKNIHIEESKTLLKDLEEARVLTDNLEKIINRIEP